MRLADWHSAAPACRYTIGIVLSWCLTTVAVADTPLQIDRQLSRIAAHAGATAHSFEAVVTQYDLELIWDPMEERIVSVALAFDFDDVETGRTRRDRDMREWLDYGRYPIAEFVMTGLADDVEGWVAHGDLTFHGVTNEVEVPFRMEREGDEVRIVGNTKIDHRDWGLEQIRAFLFLTVDPVLEIEFDLRGQIP